MVLNPRKVRSWFTITMVSQDNDEGLLHMKRMDRRTFMLVAAAGGTGAVLVACGNDPDEVDLNPTMIPVDGAPPTLAPMATPGGGGGEGEAEGGESGGGETGGDAGVVTLEAQDPFNWSTNELEAAPGQTIQITNTGVMEHDFVIDELGIHEVLPSGEPVDVTLPEDLTVGDTYVYYCSIPGHRESGMEGTLTIVEASAEAPAEEAPAGEEGAAASDAGGPVILEAQDPFNWSTNELEAAPGATIQVTNTGVMEHDFVIDELGIHEVLPSGEPVEVTLPDDLAPGDTYVYYCSIPGHRESGMEGTLTIVEASAPAAEEEAAAPAESGEEATPAESEASPAAEEMPAEEDLIAVPEEALAMMDDPSIIPLEATDPYNWSKKEISAAPGQVIRVLNRGVLEHDFVIDEFDISQVLVFGEPVDIQVPADAEVGSTHEYYCSVPGHRERGMVGVLTIVEGEGGGAATPAASPAATPADTTVVASTPVEEPAAAGGEAATAVDVSTVDLAFEPNELTIAANTDVTVTITNKGVLEHDFAVEELGILSDTVQSGDSTTVTINAAPGTYEFLCTVPGHAQAGMTGTLTVQ
jgi:plastocyanin